MQDPASIRALAARATAEFPSLNVLINNAGIMRAENLLDQQPDLADAEAIVSTNLLGPIRLTAALLPHLEKQPRATIINVSSGLAFLPMALHADLLRHQGRPPLLHALASLPTPQHQRRSSGTHPTLCRYRPDGRRR